MIESDEQHEAHRARLARALHAAHARALQRPPSRSRSRRTTSPRPLLDGRPPRTRASDCRMRVDCAGRPARRQAPAAAAPRRPRRPARSAGSSRRSARRRPRARCLPSRKPLSASHQIERPMAKPTKPSTGARLAQPVVDLLVVGAAAQHHADHAVAAARRRVCGERLAVPCARRRPRSSRCRPRCRRPGSPRSRAASARGAARRRSGRCRRRPARAGRRLGRDEQLEEELAVVLVEPVARGA